MKKVVGFLIGLAGVALGLYVGLYLMFIKGIIQIVDAFQHPPASGSEIAWGVVKIVFASLVGWGIAYAGIALGVLVGGDW